MELKEEKKKIALKKSRIEAQERLLKERERKIRTRRLIELGGIVVKSGIESLNNNALLGALLEIKDRMKEGSSLEKWKEKGASAFEKGKKSGSALIISFEKEPSREIKSKLRDMGLRWNRFRREWQGFCKKEVLEREIAGSNAKVMNAW